MVGETEGEIPVASPGAAESSQASLDPALHATGIAAVFWQARANSGAVDSAWLPERDLRTHFLLVRPIAQHQALSINATRVNAQHPHPNADVGRTSMLMPLERLQKWPLHHTMRW